MKLKYQVLIALGITAATFYFLYYTEIVVPREQAAAVLVAEEADRERMKQCFVNMYDNYSEEWDKQCQIEGMQPDCDLPLAVAAPIESRQILGQDQCIQIYK